MRFATLIRQPTAILPLLMSVAAFFLIAWVLVTVGISHPPDEGAAARIFQFLMLLQVPVALLFAFRWLPQSPRPATLVLLLQVAAALTAIGTILWLE